MRRAAPAFLRLTVGLLTVGLLTVGPLTMGLWGCAYPYTVRTVGAGETALHASVGGPLFDNLGAAIPIPAVVVGAQHGVATGAQARGMPQKTVARPPGKKGTSRYCHS
ncbi:MAG: hypothetical protein HY906_22365 [Deltaproteobacteria bacterium]|nr:hypothetical protein [Deltaproteobacteria bacterium]